jgi:hypothetical protein
VSHLPHCETCTCPNPFPVTPEGERCEAFHMAFKTYDEPHRSRCRLPAGHEGGHRSETDTFCWQRVERRLGK